MAKQNRSETDVLSALLASSDTKRTEQAASGDGKVRELRLYSGPIDGYQLTILCREQGESELAVISRLQRPDGTEAFRRVQTVAENAYADQIDRIVADVQALGLIDPTTVEIHKPAA